MGFFDFINKMHNVRDIIRILSEEEQVHTPYNAHNRRDGRTAERRFTHNRQQSRDEVDTNSASSQWRDQNYANATAPILDSGHNTNDEMTMSDAELFDCLPTPSSPHTTPSNEEQLQSDFHSIQTETIDNLLTCPICRLKYGEGERNIVQCPMSGQHVFCDICEQSFVEKKCPFCRCALPAIAIPIANRFAAFINNKLMTNTKP